MKATFKSLAPLFILVNCLDAVTAAIGISQLGIAKESNVFIHLLYPRFGDFAPVVYLPLEASLYLGMLYVGIRIINHWEPKTNSKFFKMWVSFVPYGLLWVAMLGPASNITAILL